MRLVWSAVVTDLPFTECYLISGGGSAPGLLHRTIQRQLSPKLTFAVAETTCGTGDGLLMVGCKLDGGNMRIADLFDSSRVGVRLVHASMTANGQRPEAIILDWSAVRLRSTLRRHLLNRLSVAVFDASYIFGF